MTESQRSHVIKVVLIMNLLHFMCCDCTLSIYYVTEVMELFLIETIYVQLRSEMC